MDKYMHRLYAIMMDLQKERDRARVRGETYKAEKLSKAMNCVADAREELMKRNPAKR